LTASPATFGDVDPCPETRKYLEIHYYCHNGTDKEEGNDDDDVDAKRHLRARVR